MVDKSIHQSGSGGGKLFVARHGETEWSKVGKHTGTTDLPLIESGREVARAAGKALAGRSFVGRYVSPLRRAQETAELMGLSDLTVLDDLREWDYGNVEGISSAEMSKKIGRDWEIFRDGVGPGNTPGETVEDVAARASHVLARVLPQLADGDVILVAHGHLLRILTAVFLQEQPRFAASLMLDAGCVGVLGYHHDIPCIDSWNVRH